MSYGTTLFAHIAHTKLKSQIEDTAVEALGYIFAQSQAARRALAGFLEGEDFDVGSIYRVETWEPDEKGAIPDLVCFDDCNSNHVLIEAKFWAGLTKNQPNQYLNQLQNDRKERPAALLFVAPKSRLEFLWPELCGRIMEERGFQLSIISDSGDLRSASIAGGKHRLLLTSWAALLSSMETQAREAGDTITVDDIKQLRGLTDDADPDPFVSWSPEELGSGFARRMEGLRILVDEAVRCGRSAGFLTPKSVAKGGAGGYGRSIQLGSVKAWLGIEVISWAKYHSTPLWLRLDDDGYSQLKGTELTEKMYRPDPNWSFRVPIELPSGVEYDEVLKSVVSRLQNVVLQLDSDSVGHARADFDSYRQRGHADRIDADAFLPWRREELQPKYAQQVTGLHAIIDEATSRGRNAGFLDRSVVGPKLEGYGRFIYFCGVKAWFGIDVTAWAQHGKTPMWLKFDYDEYERLANLTEDLFEVNWKHCIPIDLPGTAEEAVLKSVVASLKGISNQLKNSDS